MKIWYHLLRNQTDSLRPQRLKRMWTRARLFKSTFLMRMHLTIQPRTARWTSFDRRQLTSWTAITRRKRKKPHKTFQKFRKSLLKMSRQKVLKSSHQLPLVGRKWTKSSTICSISYLTVRLIQKGKAISRRLLTLQGRCSNPNLWIKILSQGPPELAYRCRGWQKSLLPTGSRMKKITRSEKSPEE